MLRLTQVLLLVASATPAHAAAVSGDVERCDSLPALTEGEAVRAEIDAGSPAVETELLRETSDAPTLGLAYCLRLPEGGPVTLELRSVTLDAYLVLRAPDGTVLAEDDDGLYGTHARIAFDALEADVPYRVEACARFGEHGELELSLARGILPAPSRRERVELELEERRERVARLDAEAPGSFELARALRKQGEHAYRIYLGDEAIEALERSVAIGFGLHERSALSEEELLEHVETMRVLGAVFRGLDSHALARDLYVRALELLETGESEARAELAVRTHMNLGIVTGELGDVEAALGLLEDALARSESTLGPEHPRTGDSLAQVATFLNGLDRDAEALPYHERSLAVRMAAWGEVHPDTAESLGNVGATYLFLSDYPRAVEYFEQALAVEVELYGEDSPDVARSLGALASALRRLGDYERAIELVRRGVAISERTAGPDDPRTADRLHELAEILNHLHRNEEAVPLLERASAIMAAAYGEDHAETLRAREGLGIALVGLDRYDEARRILEAVVEVRRAELGPEHPDLLHLYDSLGTICAHVGEYERAHHYARSAVDVAEAHYGADHPELLDALDGLASVEVETGNPGRATQHLERGLAIALAAFGPEHVEVARCWKRLARVRRRNDDPVGARQAAERGLAVMESALGPDNPETALLRFELARCLTLQGDFAEAGRMLELVVAVLDGEPPLDPVKLAEVLQRLSVARRKLSDWDGARAAAERSIALFQSELGSENQEVATSLEVLAETYGNGEDLERELALRRRVLAIRTALFGPDHRETMVARSNLAPALHRAGLEEEADRARESAVRFFEQTVGHGGLDTWRAVYNHGRALLRDGEPERAWEVLERGAEARRRTVMGIVGGLSEAEAFRFLGEWRILLELRLAVGARLAEPEVLATCYEDVLDWKGRIGRVRIASRELLARSASPEALQLQEDLRACQSELSRLVSDTRGGDHGQRLDELRAERELIERELLRAAGPAGEDPVGLDELVTALPEDTAVVDFFAHDWRPQGVGEFEHVCAWITRGGESGVEHVDLGPADALGEAVREYLDALVARRGFEADDSGPDASARLLALLWKPLAPHLEGVETVIVSPDSFLGTVPFEALADADGTYLIEERAFVYVQDVSSLARATGEPGEVAGDLLAVGGVDFRRGEAFQAEPIAAAETRAPSDLRGSFTDYWGRLPATEYESQVVLDLHADAFEGEASRLLLQGSAPTEPRLARELPRHSILHLATHGFFQPEGMPSMWESVASEDGGRELRLNEPAGRLVGRHPALLSGLVCAGANRGGGSTERDDGYLTAEEVGWLDLSGVQLVVLSACETGLGRALSGEGLIGLRRAFETAGAQTVVSSLWSVKDDSTSELMRDFYKNLFLKGMGRHEALRSAQLAMLQKNRMEHGEALPSTWGAFVLSGEWR